MNESPQLTTTCSFKGKQYLLQLTLSQSQLLLVLTNRLTLEKWKCSSNVEYIEAMTRKTGNFKTFPVFADMLKAVFLKSTSSVSMELLTHKDLEKLNNGRVEPHSDDIRRIYFIMIYTSEFDRIHYPLPLEYCGPPHPEILQATIKTLETDKYQLQRELEEYKCKSVQERGWEVIALKKQMTEINEQFFHVENKISNLVASMEEMKKEQEKDRLRTTRQFEEMSHALEKIKLFLEMNPVSGDFARNCACGHASDGKKTPPSRVRRRSPSPGSSSSSSISAQRSRPPTAPRSGKAIRPAVTVRSVPAEGFRHPFSESDVDTLGKQIEALQKAIVGLSNNVSKT